MNILEKETYSEPNFDIIDDVLDEIEKTTQNKNKNKVDDMSDDDWRHLGDNY